MSLDANFIQQLLKTDSEKPTVPAVPDLVCECGTRLDNGYCLNELCSIDAPIETSECNTCGCCSTPGKCVASIVCPRCLSDVSSLCIDDRGGLTGYHEERWNRVKELYGTYYK